jgi:hypothetical protein
MSVNRVPPNSSMRNGIHLLYCSHKLWKHLEDLSSVIIFSSTITFLWMSISCQISSCTVIMVFRKPRLPSTASIKSSQASRYQFFLMMQIVGHKFFSCPVMDLKMFVLVLEPYPNKLFITFFVFHWCYYPTSIKHGAPSMSKQNNNAVPCGQSLLDCQDLTSLHL